MDSTFALTIVPVILDWREKGGQYHCQFTFVMLIDSGVFPSNLLMSFTGAKN